MSVNRNVYVSTNTKRRRPVSLVAADTRRATRGDAAVARALGISDHPASPAQRGNPAPAPRVGRGRSLASAGRTGPAHYQKRRPPMFIRRILARAAALLTALAR